jgi:hypothetical protein
MSAVKQQAPLFHVGDWVAFHFGSGKVAARVIEDRGGIGVGGRRLYRVDLDEAPDGGSAFEVPENELEATSPPVRQAIDVTYARQGNTNVWHASAKPGAVLKGIKAKGAFGFSTGFWRGQADQTDATVSVLLEVDPRLSDPNRADAIKVSPQMMEQARDFADEMFLSRFPRARIEHRGP